MMHARGAIKPVQEMSEEAGNPIDPSDFIAAVAGYYSSSDGKLISMPFNSSTPVLYYNKDAFKKAGLDPDNPPKTWKEVAEAGKKLREAGMECGYTTGWPSWIQLETFAAWHNVPFTTKNNGFGGLDAELAVDSPAFVKHFESLAQMSKDGSFTYGGRGMRRTPCSPRASAACSPVRAVRGRTSFAMANLNLAHRLALPR